MEFIFRICLIVAGIINFIPSVLAFVPSRIGEAYGIEVLDSNDELLLRHRAILFGIIGGTMIYSAITKKNYSMAVLMGCISMISFMLLFMLGSGEINAELTKVLKMDIAGLVILLIGYTLFKLK